MEINLNNSIDDDSVKVPRVRSVAYPSNTIEHCIKLVSNIYKLFGSSVYIARDQLAKKLSISESHIQTQLSSCVQYGLLELKAKLGYKPTKLFTKIYKPLPNEDVRLSKIEAFRQPELYQKIIAEYDNEIHTVDALATILFRNYKVSETASTSAAKVFLENAKDLLLLNDDGLFQISVVPDTDAIEVLDGTIEENTKNDAIEVKYLPPANDTPKEEKPQNKSFKHPPIPIFCEDGSVAELYLPNGFNKPDVERVVNVLKAYLL